MINWGEIFERWDPIYNLYNLNFSQRFAFDEQKLRTCLKAEPFYGANEIGLERKTKSETRYIRITDIDDFGRLSNSLGATCLNIEDKYLLEYGDLLIARSGNTVGKSYLHDCKDNFEAYIFAGYLINFKIDKSKVSPKYVFYYLQSSFFQKWKNATMRLAGQPNINAQEYKNMLIPIPGSTVQQQIIDIMDAAYTEKQQKEKQAQELLDSINSYLLGELGVTIPLEEDNTLESRKFYANSADVLGGRFDPRKYTKKYYDIFDALQNSLLPKKQLREIVLSDIAGNWGLDETEGGSDLISCLTIRATEFDNKYNLNLDNNRTKYRKYIPRIFAKIMLLPEDILIEKSGGSDDQPVGRVAFIEKEMTDNLNLAYSNFIHKIIVDKEKADPRFVFEYLRLMHNIKVTQVMQTQTNGIRNLIMGEYFRQPILLPDINIQRTIACEASAIRNKAKLLEQEADDVVKSAKAKVEKILLEGSL